MLKLTEQGKAFIEKPSSFLLLKEHDFSNTDDDENFVSSGKGGAFDESLYDLLLDLRKSVAKQMGVPPFVVFQDPSLKDMCLQYPITMDELTHIQGVGVGKAQRFGEPFVDLIAHYVEENDIDRPQDFFMKSLVNKSGLKVQLIQNIDRKLPLEDIARSQSKSFEEILEEIESLGTPSPAPGLMSFTMYVPASVPSVRQSSLPVEMVGATKNVCVPASVMSLGL